MSQNMRTTPAIRRRISKVGGLSAASLAAVLRRLGFAYRVYRERRALMSLSDHQLKDIGLSRSQAHREGARSFFDLPQ